MKKTLLILTLVFVNFASYAGESVFFKDSFWIKATPGDVKRQIQAGADVNAVSSKGGTALLLASMISQNPAVIEELVKNGANINYKSKNDGFTALIIASAFNPNPMVAQTLIKNGADTSIKDSLGKTAAQYAKENPFLKK